MSKIYMTIWRAKWTCDGSDTPLEMAEKLEEQAQYLRALHADGIKLREPMTDDYAFLETEDAAIAEKWGIPEDEDWDEEEEYDEETEVKDAEEKDAAE